MQSSEQNKEIFSLKNHCMPGMIKRKMTSDKIIPFENAVINKVQYPKGFNVVRTPDKRRCCEAVQNRFIFPKPNLMKEVNKEVIFQTPKNSKLSSTNFLTPTKSIESISQGKTTFKGMPINFIKIPSFNEVRPRSACPGAQDTPDFKPVTKDSTSRMSRLPIHFFHGKEEEKVAPKRQFKNKGRCNRERFNRVKESAKILRKESYCHRESLLISRNSTIHSRNSLYRMSASEESPLMRFVNSHSNSFQNSPMVHSKGRYKYKRIKKKPASNNKRPLKPSFPSKKPSQFKPKNFAPKRRIRRDRVDCKMIVKKIRKSLTPFRNKPKNLTILDNTTDITLQKI
ncbi:unnamed protein product [Moneuplotes crassus]|uniref:Uncharacterized protein n=1 Tax=Euplotes crassus TaxID=5936 RepID=A0AAD1Y7F4_EUPCR|nr:unnamed protein product [Moneuplotes crassus]